MTASGRPSQVRKAAAAPKSPWSTILIASAVTAPVAVFASCITQPTALGASSFPKSVSDTAPFPKPDKPAVDAFERPATLAPKPGNLAAGNDTVVPIVLSGNLPPANGATGGGTTSTVGAGDGKGAPEPLKPLDSVKAATNPREEKSGKEPGAEASVYPEAEAWKSEAPKLALTPSVEPTPIPPKRTPSQETPADDEPAHTGLKAVALVTEAPPSGSASDNPTPPSALTLPQVKGIEPTDTDSTVAVQTLFLDRLSAAPGVKGSDMVDAQNQKALTTFLKALQKLRQKGYVPFSVTSSRLSPGEDGIEGVRSELWLYLPSGGKVTPTAMGGGGVLKQFLGRLKVK